MNHIIGNLTSFRLAGYDMEPCWNFNGPLAGLRPSWVWVILFVIDSLDGSEERRIWVLGGANPTFLNDDRAAADLQTE